MNPTKPISKKPTLEELVFGALSQLQALHYDGRSIRRYQTIWNRLLKFAKLKDLDNKLSERLIIQFLEYYAIKPDALTSTKPGWRKHAEYGLRILWQFSRYGYFERLHTLLQELKLSSVMMQVLNDYVKYSKEKRYISNYCVNERIRQVSLFLDFVVREDVTAFEQIQPQHLSLFINSLWRYSHQTISRVVSDIRQFLKYLFLKNVIDEVELRQAIEKQLNRIELSNKFSKAILFGNNQETQYSGKEEQEMVVGCQRLIQNAIVLWNELYLSQKLANTEDEEKRQAVLKIIRNGSMLVWQHVNLYGEYDFTQDTEQLAQVFDLEKILALVIS
jgi:hypothetical protein